MVLSENDCVASVGLEKHSVEENAYCKTKDGEAESLSNPSTVLVLPDCLYARHRKDPSRMIITDCKHLTDDSEAIIYGYLSYNVRVNNAKFRAVSAGVPSFSIEPSSSEVISNGFYNHTPAHWVLIDNTTKLPVAMAARNGGWGHAAEFHVRAVGDQRYWKMERKSLVSTNMTIKETVLDEPLNVPSMDDPVLKSTDLIGDKELVWTEIGVNERDHRTALIFSDCKDGTSICPPTIPFHLRVFFLVLAKSYWASRDQKRGQLALYAAVASK